MSDDRIPLGFAVAAEDLTVENFPENIRRLAEGTPGIEIDSMEWGVGEGASEAEQELRRWALEQAVDLGLAYNGASELVSAVVAAASMFERFVLQGLPAVDEEDDPDFDEVEPVRRLDA